MKTPSVVIGLLIIPLCAQAALEFSSYLQRGAEFLFVVSDTDTSRTSDFLRLGQSFQDYTVRGFNLETEVLTVERRGERLNLKLKDSRVRDDDKTAPAGNRVVLGVTVGGNGELSVNGRSLTLDGLAATLEEVRKRGEEVEIALHEPTRPDPKHPGWVKAIMQVVKNSGVEKWRVRIVDAPRASGAGQEPRGSPR